MKKCNLTFLLILFHHFLFAQNPLVKQWDYRFGGWEWDVLTCFKQTSDGGFILGGYSQSGNSGDKTQQNWDTIYPYLPDYWIVKTDSLGSKLWDKDFGGIDWDELYSLQQTNDGGYILGGSSQSGVSGDKTQPVWGMYDYWIVKIDSLGNKQWDKDFGGVKSDILRSIQQTADGGYILGGYSESDSSGDKSQMLWDTCTTLNCVKSDYWIVKTDSFGNKQWDKDFGGMKSEKLFSIQQTADGGYILGGYSESGIGGDKTQPVWAFAEDYWILKIDSLGTKLWDKDFGGYGGDRLYSLQETSDRGFILGGVSSSNIGGDKTQNSWGSYDYWMIKIDSLGNKQWDKDFGGISIEDDFGSISQTADKGYLMAGTSYSDSSGNKTENNLGNEQTWVVKTDSLGIKQWDKTLHTQSNPDDEIGFAMQLSNGCYLMGNWTDAEIAGDKTQPAWYLSFDYWIIKFCDTTLTTNLTPTLSKGEGVAIAPNPFTDEITITFQKQNIKQATITVKNILGQPVLRHERKAPLSFGEGSGVRWDLSFLSKGIYLLEVIADGERSFKKIIKE